MTHPFRPHGIVVPMATPVTPAGALDPDGVRRVVEWLVKGGVHGIFLLGTTGEAPSLSPAAKHDLVALGVEHVAGRCAVYTGIGGNSLAESIGAAHQYRRLGVDAVVAHLPSYFPLNGDEMVAYYRRLADEVETPLLIYNMPQTTHMSISLDALTELSTHPRIVGAKDSENDLQRLRGVIAAFARAEHFAVLIGPSVHATVCLRDGADGIVPSSGNLAPRMWRELYEHARAGRWSDAGQMQERLDALAGVYQKGRSLGQSMAALKAAMAGLGLCRPDALPPLATVGGAEQRALAAAVEAAGVVG